MSALQNKAEVHSDAGFSVLIKPAIDQMLGQGSAEKVDIATIVKEGAASLDIAAAIAAVKPPPEVVKLLSARGLSKSTLKAAPDLDPAAVQKAVDKLNGMIESAQTKLDGKTIECTEFKEKKPRHRRSGYYRSESHWWDDRKFETGGVRNHG
jgi:hypothetical protein